MSVEDAPKIRQTEPGRLRTLLMEHRQPVILLGAGASVKSGVPDARKAVALAARWAWCKEHGRSIEDSAVVDSDWHTWLESRSWFQKDVGFADQYPVAIDNLLTTGADRREFFEEIISRNVYPSQGYHALARIMDSGWVPTVLTTNFDHCLHRAAIIEAAPPLLVEIKTPFDWKRFSAAPANPQLIYIHGSVEHYSDKNLAHEVSKMDQTVVDHLAPLLRDHPLIVIGYRGMEASVMSDLLLNQSEYTNSFHNGIFWCDLKSNIKNPLVPMAQNLADCIRQNFNRVPIEGFDHLLQVDLYDQLITQKTARKPLGPFFATADLPPDMRVFDGGAYGDLDQELLFERLKKYADRHSEPIPDQLDGDWVVEFALAKKILQRVNGDAGKVQPTLAGWVMFARNPTDAMPNAVIRIEAKGPKNWLRPAFEEVNELGSSDSEGEFTIKREVGGTLWNQLEFMVETARLLNPSFLLKEAKGISIKSRPVTAHDLLALREMIVNALVHRDYEMLEPITVRMTPSQVETISPGGLVHEVVDKAGGKPIEEIIREGVEGELKGYRNPVISGFFYGCYEMERQGSGLSDILKRATSNNGDAHFKSVTGNSAFKTVILARPEAVNEITRTAIADEPETVQSTANLIQLRSVPRRVWKAAVKSNISHGIRNNSSGSLTPPGHAHDGFFFSFYDLAQLAAEGKLPFDKGEIEEIAAEDLLSQRNGHIILNVLILHCVIEHFQIIGLSVDRKRSLAYFRGLEAMNREITYKDKYGGQAKRSVVQFHAKSESNRIAYYEHKSFIYSISQINGSWWMLINPTYVFTRDGQREYPRRTPRDVISARRGREDFNGRTWREVAFWKAYIMGGSHGAPALKTDPGNKFTDYAPTIFLSNGSSAGAFASAVFSYEDPDKEEQDGKLTATDLEHQDVGGEERKEAENGAGAAGQWSRRSNGLKGEEDQI